MAADRTYLTSVEVSRLTRLTPSSVRRLADEGRLPFTRTAGGHRRYLRDDVERFLTTRSGEHQRAHRLAPGWLDELFTPDLHTLLGAIHSARGRLGSWARVGDELSEAFRSMGLDWANGLLSVVDEHLATERFQRALGQVSGNLVARGDGPVCLLATPEGEDHTLGLNFAELTARELGWQTLWVGRSVPAKALAQFITKHHVDVVALSASEHSGDRNALEQCLRTLRPATSHGGVPVVLGGRGLWPEAYPGTVRIETFARFRFFLETHQEERARRGDRG